MNIQEELRINKKQPVYGFAGTDIGNFYKALIEDCKSHGWTIEQNIYFFNGSGVFLWNNPRKTC